MSVTENEIAFPIKINVMIGVRIGEITVETAVSDTDNVRSPFARKVITSDAVPPGTVPTRTRPTVKASFKENKLAIVKANRGIIKYCAETPNNISLGLLNTFTKCSAFNVVPIPNRITPKRTFIIFIPINFSNTQLKVLGFIKAMTTLIIISIK